jgi:pantetheine-phosphate adenylyltransferase
MSKIAVFAGSFDPFTVGHLDIVKRGASLFDEVYVLLAVNASKKYMLPESVRLEIVRQAVADLPNVKVDAFEGLTVDFMKRVGAKFLLRGIRGTADVEYEQTVAWNNKELYPQCETVLLSSAPEHLMVSSTVVRELLKAGVACDAAGREKLSKYVPTATIPMILDALIPLKTNP